MGFKKLINSKKTLSLLAVFMLLGTNLLMAQDCSSCSSYQRTADAAKVPCGQALAIMCYCFY